MCGIVAVLEIKRGASDLREKALAAARTIRHRGPDWSGVWMDERCVLAHERLAIVDVDNGAQPLLDTTGDVALAANGEIYTHNGLQRGLTSPYPFRTQSDCEVILPLYAAHGAGVANLLSGIFAFVLYDRRTGDWLVAGAGGRTAASRAVASTGAAKAIEAELSDIATKSSALSDRRAKARVLSLPSAPRPPVMSPPNARRSRPRPAP